MTTIDITSPSDRLRHRLALRKLLDHRHAAPVRAAPVERKYRPTADHRREPERIAGSRWQRVGDNDWIRVD